MGSIAAPAAIKVLVLGGSYGGLSAALNLHDLCNGRQARTTLHLPDEEKGKRPFVPVEIKVVDERDGYYHLIGTPLTLASTSYAYKSWVPYASLPALQAPGLSWTQGTVTSVNTSSRTATILSPLTGHTFLETYDYLILATGLRRRWPTVPQSLTQTSYLAETGEHIRDVEEAGSVVVVGGGAVGIEMAAELKITHPKLSVSLVHSHERLLSAEPLPDDFGDRSAAVLRETGVELILNERVVSETPLPEGDGKKKVRITLGSGKVMEVGKVIWAISAAVPSTEFLPKEALNEDGFVKVTKSLALPSAPHVFALGDIAARSGIKRCGGAMAMGTVVATNIHKSILHQIFGTDPSPFKEYPEVEPMIALAIGEQAVMYSPQEGTTWGEDKMEMMFGDDLGWSIVWNYLRLGEVPRKVKLQFEG